jgi:hypothetical protein
MRAWQRLAAVPDRIDAVVAAGALAFEDDDSALAAARTLRIEERGETLVVLDPDEGERWRLSRSCSAGPTASVKADAVLDQLGTGRNRILRTSRRTPRTSSIGASSASRHARHNAVAASALASTTRLDARP